MEWRWMVMRIRIAAAVVTFLLFLLEIGYVAAAVQPNAANSVNVLNSSRRDNGAVGSTIQAEAGNVTLLYIDDLRTTLRWQGYYGNVSGGITLQDSSGNKFYDWSLTSPSGEVYAANKSSVSWTTIQCFNYSKAAGEQVITLRNLEDSYNMNATDKDGVNETFNATYQSTFKVGTKTISSADSCPTAYTFVNSLQQASSFPEVLLTDNVSAIVYTALLEQDATGFDGLTHDFQMIVGENGDDAAVTNYYFFVELE
jgi:hypothetical protein